MFSTESDALEAAGLEE
jgi:hypothetical protein